MSPAAVVKKPKKKSVSDEKFKIMGKVTEGKYTVIERRGCG